MKKLDKQWKILVEAKKYLASSLSDEIDGKTVYVCHALDRVIARGNTVQSNLHSDLQDFINQDLDGYYTFYSWMYNKYPNLRKSIANDFNCKDSVKLQETKLNWMNNMIERLKEADL